MSDFKGEGIVYSGWNDRPWSEYLYLNNYINSRNDFVCPSWAPFQYSTRHNTYGMLMSHNTEFFRDAVTSLGSYTLLSNKVPHPSDYFLHADSFSLTTNTASVVYQKQVSSVAVSSVSTSRIHTRHNNNANIVFLDGHAASCGESAIIDSAKKTNGDSATVTIVNKNLIEIQIYP